MTPPRTGHSSSTWVGIIAALVVVLPPLIYGPWLPFVDLVAFVGLNSYPPQASGGPFHYYIFQFTYIGHYAASRLLLDLGVPVAGQIMVFYLAQGAVFFGVVWRTLEHAVREPGIRNIAIALGALAFWDGLFLWGGPLAYSLAATLIAAATFLAYREAAGIRPAGGMLLMVLCTGAITCHPFALPFAALVVGLRLLFVPSSRIQSGAMLAAVAAFGWIIHRDSPPLETAMVSQLPQLVSLAPANAWARLTGLFTSNVGAVRDLFMDVPASVTVYFALLALVRLAGFLASPFVVWRAKDDRGLRFLAALNTAIGLAYFTSCEQPAVIPEWPQRILTFWSSFTFIAGIAVPLYLLHRLPRTRDLASRLSPRAGWALAGGVMVLLILVQIPVLRHGGNLGRSYEQVRAQILQTGVAKAFIVVSDMDTVYPFYLRSVPFLLFSDPRMIERELLFYTEWHFQPRHATRLAETWLDLGRPRYLARFAPANGLLAVELAAQPAGEFAIPARTRSGEHGFGEITNQTLAHIYRGSLLVQAGANRDAIAHYRTVLRHTPDDAQVHNKLAIAFFNLGQVREAIEHLQSAVKLQPDYIDARMNLGQLLQHTGNPREALGHFEAVMKAHPEHLPAREAVAKLKSSQ